MRRDAVAPRDTNDAAVTTNVSNDSDRELQYPDFSRYSNKRVFQVKIHRKSRLRERKIKRKGITVHVPLLQ